MDSSSSSRARPRYSGYDWAKFPENTDLADALTSHRRGTSGTSHSEPLSHTDSPVTASEAMVNRDALTLYQTPANERPQRLIDFLNKSAKKNEKSPAARWQLGTLDVLALAQHGLETLSNLEQRSAVIDTIKALPHMENQTEAREFGRAFIPLLSNWLRNPTDNKNLKDVDYNKGNRLFEFFMRVHDLDGGQNTPVLETEQLRRNAIGIQHAFYTALPPNIFKVFDEALPPYLVFSLTKQLKQIGDKLVESPELATDPALGQIRDTRNQAEQHRIAAMERRAALRDQLRAQETAPQQGQQAATVYVAPHGKSSEHKQILPLLASAEVIKSDRPPAGDVKAHNVDPTAHASLDNRSDNAIRSSDQTAQDRSGPSVPRQSLGEQRTGTTPKRHVLKRSRARIASQPPLHSRKEVSSQPQPNQLISESVNKPLPRLPHDSGVESLQGDHAEPISIEEQAIPIRQSTSQAADTAMPPVVGKSTGQGTASIQPKRLPSIAGVVKTHASRARNASPGEDDRSARDDNAIRPGGQAAQRQAAGDRLGPPLRRSERHEAGGSIPEQPQKPTHAEGSRARQIHHETMISAASERWGKSVSQAAGDGTEGGGIAGGKSERSARLSEHPVQDSRRGKGVSAASMRPSYFEWNEENRRWEKWTSQKHQPKDKPLQYDALKCSSVAADVEQDSDFYGLINVRLTNQGQRVRRTGFLALNKNSLDPEGRDAMDKAVRSGVGVTINRYSYGGAITLRERVPLQPRHQQPQSSQDAHASDRREPPLWRAHHHAPVFLSAEIANQRKGRQTGATNARNPEFPTDIEQALPIRTRNTPRKFLSRLPGKLGTTYPPAFSLPAPSQATRENESQSPAPPGFREFVIDSSSTPAVPKNVRVKAQPNHNSEDLGRAFTLTDSNKTKMDFHVHDTNPLGALVLERSGSPSQFWNFNEDAKNGWQANPSVAGRKSAMSSLQKILHRADSGERKGRDNEPVILR